MRRGLMLWREQELSVVDLRARQQRLERAVQATGLDAFLVYTNHVRSAGVTYLTGFTPYWTDALLLIVPGQPPLFSTTLSKRVGPWARSLNPTAEIVHSPKPGGLVGERLAAFGCRRVGVLELDRLPAAHASDIASAATIDLVDATEIFAGVRTEPDTAELKLVRLAAAMARDALAAIDVNCDRASEAAAVVEHVARHAGAEECYIAMAPDLDRDARFGRVGHAAFGRSFAIRLSLAYNGVWIRRSRTFARDAEVQRGVDRIEGVMRRLAPGLNPAHPLGPQLERLADGLGATLTGWRLEAPGGNLPLTQVADAGHDTGCKIPYGVLGAGMAHAQTTVLVGGLVGLALSDDGEKAAA